MTESTASQVRQEACPGCGANLGHTHNCSYVAYLSSLQPCPECGEVDEMDNITGQLLCARCELCGSFSDDCDCWEDADAA